MKTNFVGWISTLARTHTRPLAAVAVREGLAQFEAVDAVQEAFSTLLALSQAREPRSPGPRTARCRVARA